ncbi:MAG: hypothetical protein C0432_05110 [Candidatus Puniceispirillum sp.]|nr:hypothetical protein [Candidatus Pelagibacter sp.]MBA4283654.1 hypothetical protein [Candidatus Puniceispirillum sp.]
MHAADKSSNLNRDTHNKPAQAEKREDRKVDHHYLAKLKDIQINYHKVLEEIRVKLESESKKNCLQTNHLEDAKKKIKLLEIHYQELVSSLKSSAPTPKLNQKIDISLLMGSDSAEWIEQLKKAYDSKAKKNNDGPNAFYQTQDLPVSQKSVPTKTLDYDDQMINKNFTPYNTVQEIDENLNKQALQYE